MLTIVCLALLVLPLSPKWTSAFALGVLLIAFSFEIKQTARLAGAEPTAIDVASLIGAFGAAAFGLVCVLKLAHAMAPATLMPSGAAN